MKLDIVINSKGRIFQMQLMMAPSISACVLFPSGLFKLRGCGTALLFLAMLTKRQESRSRLWAED